jgi:3,4-dihydroxy 2-butanone 4-phosphate synthase / GTP cyclohydrolase II
MSPNGAAKRIGLEGYGLSVAERVPLKTEPTVENTRYLHTKQNKMGHWLDLSVETAAPNR